MATAPSRSPAPPCPLPFILHERTRLRSTVLRTARIHQLTTARLQSRMVAAGHDTCPARNWSGSGVRLRSYHCRVRCLHCSIMDGASPATMDQAAHYQKSGLGRQADGRGRGTLRLARQALTLSLSHKLTFARSFSPSIAPL
jgi:hypothetical protein